MVMMQILIVTILFVAVQVGAFPQDEHHDHTPPPFLKKCLESSGLNKLPGMADMGTERHHIPHEITEEFLCFLKCMGEEEGLFLPNGEVDLDKVDEFKIHHMPPEKKEGLKQCLTKIVKVEECKDLTEMAECVKELHRV